MKKAERLARAAMVARIVEATQEVGRTWTAAVWEGGHHVRVYLRRSGSDMGYLSIDDDGDVVGVTSSARGIHVVDSALSRAGIEAYS